MKLFKLVLFILLPLVGFGQNTFHVYSKNHAENPGKSTGNGSLDSPWDLQTALSQAYGVVRDGDTILLHQGVFSGRFISTIHSKSSLNKIIVSAYKNDKVVLNGNVISNNNAVLIVKGSNVIFKNFEITFHGDFYRHEDAVGFKHVSGISHLDGENCEFINLKIHNNPGSGIGSWKRTGGTIIMECTIYNNGYDGKRGHGVGIYVQNQSDKTRLILNNTIFNNYYKGIEVWSATSGTNFEFVKNITLKHNVIFNNGVPAGVHKDNVIIASNDAKGVNIAKNIKLNNNILYHNIDFSSQQNFGAGASLTLGYNSKALVEDIEVKHNIILGRNNALNFTHVKSLNFSNNTVYCGYVHYEKTTLKNLNTQAYKSNFNKYYSRKESAFRVANYNDFTLQDLQSRYKLEVNSTRDEFSEFKLNEVLSINRINSLKNTFRVALFSKEENVIKVKVNNFNIKKGTRYNIYDVENPSVILRSGIVKLDYISFPMKLTKLEKPSHNSKAKKSANNFGVFVVKFKKRKTFFSRWFGWI